MRQMRQYKKEFNLGEKLFVYKIKCINSTVKIK